MKNFWFLIISAAVSFFSCQPSAQTETIQTDTTEVAIEEGVRMIPIQSPKGEFKVWTKRVGDNPTMKVLLLHGGPGMTHEQYGNFEDYFPRKTSSLFFTISWDPIILISPRILRFGRLIDS